MTVTPPLARLSLRRLLGHSAQVFRSDFLALMGLAILVHGPGVAAEDWLSARMGAVIAARPTAAALPWVAGIVPFALADGAVVWVAVRRLAGRSLPFGGPKGVARLAGAVLAIDLVENLPGLAQVLLPPEWLGPLNPGASVLFSVAGAFWLALWFPALAVAVAEGATGAASLGRSLDLTRGHRWTLATLALALQLGILGLALLGALLLALAGFVEPPAWTLDLAGLPLWAFSSAAQAGAYWELQRLKTGLSPAAAKLFD
ncbi:MAG: hypothetical protein JO127_18660 [Caulobacteraceae bacterium]|nr:hypothetical protein [Caulobacteraceae bacterium]